MLAKRLIYGQSASMDAEEAMINKLKVCTDLPGITIVYSVLMLSLQVL